MSRLWPDPIEVFVSSRGLQATRYARPWRQRFQRVLVAQMTQPFTGAVSEVVDDEIKTQWQAWLASSFVQGAQVQLVLGPSLARCLLLPAASTWLSAPERQALARHAFKQMLGETLAPQWAAWHYQLAQTSLAAPLLASALAPQWAGAPAVTNAVPALVQVLQTLPAQTTGWLVCADEARVHTAWLEQDVLMSLHTWVWEGQEAVALLLRRHQALAPRINLASAVPTNYWFSMNGQEVQCLKN